MYGHVFIYNNRHYHECVDTVEYEAFINERRLKREANDLSAMERLIEKYPDRAKEIIDRISCDY